MGNDRLCLLLLLAKADVIKAAIPPTGQVALSSFLRPWRS